MFSFIQQIICLAPAELLLMFDLHDGEDFYTVPYVLKLFKRMPSFWFCLWLKAKNVYL